MARQQWETSSEFALRLLDAADVDPEAVTRLLELYREARFSEPRGGRGGAPGGRRRAGPGPRERSGRSGERPAPAGLVGPRRRSSSLVVVVGQVVFTLLDFEPQLLGWALLADRRWGPAVAAPRRCRDPAPRAGTPAAAVRATGRRRGQTSTSRVLDSHLDARDPGPALRDRLVALARSRDPDLTDPVLRDLAQQPARRLTPDDIDRYLTRIEELT